MHYAKDAFGKSSASVTMETLDPKFQVSFYSNCFKGSSGVSQRYAPDSLFSLQIFRCRGCKNHQFQNVIGRVMDAAPSDYLKICSIYNCKQCMMKPFTAETIAEYERQRNTSILPFTTTPYPLRPEPVIPPTRATRLPLRPITIAPPLPPITAAPSIPDPHGSDCNDRFFCPTILNAWNKDFMCRMKSVQTWCCLTCAGNRHKSVWFRFGVAD